MASGRLARFAAFTAVLSVGNALAAQQVDVGQGSVVTAVANLRPGEFIWAPQAAPDGPMLMIVNLKAQRAILYRNGVPIAATTVSTGRPRHETPTGVFSVLQKHLEHYSSKYDNAPMPYMQRLTWKGVALHAGNLPGYPASHGCIRLPPGFAKLLYGVSTLGMTVVIVSRAESPRLAPAPELVLLPSGPTSASPETVEWNPERSPTGPISIVVSAADGRAIVLRDGVKIGSAPVTVDGAVDGTWIYVLRSGGASGKHWVRMSLSSSSAGGSGVSRDEWRRFHAPEQFRQAVAAIVETGTTIVVTADSLVAGSTGTEVTVADDQPPQRHR